MLDGIDVSKYQQNIDWTATTASPLSPTLSFAIARASYGDTTNNPDVAVDLKFVANWQGALDAGLVVGAYHFFLPRSDLSQIDLQAANFLAQVHAALRPGDLNYLPAILDVEELPNGVQVSDYVAGIGRWIALVEADPIFANMKTIIYVQKSKWEAIGNPDGFGSNPLWVLDYSQNPPRLPASWNDWAFFQYTDQGQRTGIGGTSVDLDYFKGDAATLKLLTRASVAAGPSTSTP